MLKQLEVFAFKRLVPEVRVTAIRRGNGLIDGALDGVAIAGVFLEFATVLAGKHPFTPEEIAEIAEHGNWLIHHLNPSGARTEPSPRDEAAVIRDRFWTALLAAYAPLRKAGLYLWSEAEVDDHVPLLQSREKSAPAAEAPAAAPPAVPPAPMVDLKVQPVGPEAVVTPPKPAK